MSIKPCLTYMLRIPEGKVPKSRFAGVAMLAGVLVATCPAPAFAAAPPPRTTHGPCQYTQTPDEPAARPVPLPRDPRHTPDRGTVDVLLTTNRGPIPLALDRAK